MGKRGCVRHLGGGRGLWVGQLSLCGAPPQGLCNVPHDQAARGRAEVSGSCPSKWKQFMTRTHGGTATAASKMARRSAASAARLAIKRRLSSGVALVPGVAPRLPYVRLTDGGGGAWSRGCASSRGREGPIR